MGVGTSLEKRNARGRVKAIKRLWWVAGVLVVVAAFGFWARPVSYFNEALYVRERISGVENRSVQVAGHCVHYLARGPAGGPVVVLVHGLGGQAEDWRNLAPYLAKAGFRVYLPDLPGYGRSERPADFSYSMHDEAEAVVGFLDALGLHRVDLGGWSMGGWIVQIIANEAPGRVARLMLFDSAGIYAVPDWDTQLFMPANVEQVGQLEALLMPHPPNMPGFVARDILRLSIEHRRVVQRAMAAMLTGRDVTDNMLPEMKMPVLILWGAEDRITPLNLAEKMHRLVPQSELDVVAGCGHLAPVQCAGEIGPRVAAFLQQ